MEQHRGVARSARASPRIPLYVPVEELYYARYVKVRVLVASRREAHSGVMGQGPFVPGRFMEAQHGVVNSFADRFAFQEVAGRVYG